MAVATESAKTEDEEVFAEDYDDPGQQVIKPQTVSEPQSYTEKTNDRDSDDDEDETLVHERINCPNSSNKYHKCSSYCRERFGLKKFTPDPKMDRRRLRMLIKYPLPKNWLEVGDPETGRYYYWNTETNQISWLPPQHPRAAITMSTEIMPVDDRKTEHVMASGSDEDVASAAGDEQAMELDLDEQDFEALEQQVMKEKKDRERRHGRQKRVKDELDPMDPAAYSDIPRGTWSDGLERQGSAKTGVDATASGPLFQQRPYPNPGAILRMNKELSKDSK